jgi:hypothetical protein
LGSYVVSEKSLSSTKESLTNAFVGGRGKAILIAIVARKRTVKRGIVFRIPAEAMYFSFFQSVKAGCGAHPASSVIGIRVSS